MSKRPPVVCEVVRRGRLLVAEPFFEDGQQFSLGRRGSPAATAGMLVAVRPAAGRAVVVEELGSPRDLAAVLRGFAIEAGVGEPFPDDVLNEAELAALEPDGLDPGRIDLRDVPCVTIDPPTARDFDDAIAVLPDGDGLRVLVHIADVAFHVRPGGPIDREAERRAFSVYLPGHVEPMLPHALSSSACSLLPDRPRRAVTVDIHVSADGTLGSPRFLRSLIQSSARLTYDEVREILEQGAEHPQSELLRRADAFAATRRSARFARGALALSARELVITVADGSVRSASWDTEPRAHALVEELMLLANEAVATLLATKRVPALYRVHDQPDEEAVERLLGRMAALGVPIAPMPETPTGPDLMRVIGRQAVLVAKEVTRRGHGQEALTSQLLRSMRLALYAAAPHGHAGLASPAYTHFTSPIRRYPDLIVHRALLAATSSSEIAPDAAELAAIAEHCSVVEREASGVERRADRICLAWLLREQLQRDGLHQSFPGEIIGLISAGLFVRFASVFEGFVPVRRLSVTGDWFELDEHGVALQGRSGFRYRLGDAIDVVVSSIDAPRGKVTLDVTDNM